MTKDHAPPTLPPLPLFNILEKFEITQGNKNDLNT